MTSRPQPDPLSTEARAILEAPDQPRLVGELTAEVARMLRDQAAAGRAPKVAAVAERLGASVSRRDGHGAGLVEVRAPTASEAVGRAFFLHGGGFTGGMAYDMSSVLMADALGVPLYSLDYPLAPEAVYPAALEAAVEAYAALTTEFPGPWAVLGVSAGANLALALTQRIRHEGLASPAALGLFSPWTDLTGAGDSRTGNDGRDPVLRWVEQLPIGAAAYAAGHPLDDPLLSPIYATFDAEFPPSIITTGTRDVFLSDCTRLYWALRRAGARAELRVWENLWHAFNTQPGVPEAAEARSEVAAFLVAALRDAGR